MVSPTLRTPDDESARQKSIMKRIVICCDDTWNRPDQAHDGQTCASNVTKIARSIAPVDSGRIRPAITIRRILRSF